MISKSFLRLAKNMKGFTLIELIVVISLFSVMFMVTLPRLDDALTPDRMNRTVRWFITNVRSFRNAAIRGKKNYLMEFDLDAGTIYQTDPAIPDEERSDDNRTPVFTFPDTIRVLDLDFPGQGKISFGKTGILFHREGYSDMALIHLEDDDHRQVTIRIEPFLPTIRTYDDYEEFGEM